MTSCKFVTVIHLGTVNWLMHRMLIISVVLVSALAVGCSRQTHVGSVHKAAAGAGRDSKPIDLAKVKPNEVGRVLILEYHDVGPEEGRWARRGDNFRADLQRLYQLGYQPISLRDYVRNHVNTSAGKSPVILTFDDATKGQFNVINAGGQTKVDSNCAVGIMKDFSRTHPDWPLRATFYAYYPVPFRQKEYIGYKMRQILALGMDIGNHTYTHTRLDRLSDADAAKEMALNVKSAQAYAPEAIVDSIALPYGKGPKNKALLKSGSYQGTSYNNIAALLVGAEPAPSPVSKGFDPYRLPRVQAIQSELDLWLGYFKRRPEQRYISDGDPDTVTVPKSMADKVDKTKLGPAKLRIY